MIDFVHAIAIFIGIVLVAIGFGAVLFPKFSAAMYGLPVATAQLPYVQATGIRDMCLGITYLYLFFYSDLRCLAVVTFFTAGVGAFDFFLTKKNKAGIHAYGHLAATILLCAYGYLLLKIS